MNGIHCYIEIIFFPYLVRSALQRRGKQRARRRSSAGVRGALREQTDRGWSQYNGPASLLLLHLILFSPIYFIFFHLLFSPAMFLKISRNLAADLVSYLTTYLDL